MSGASRIGIVTWIALLALTGISMLFAECIVNATLIATICIIFGGIKARIIFTNFMELKPKMLPWRVLLELWVVLAVLAILIPYWISTF